MPELQERFGLNDQSVIAKVMDGEAVIINLANGMYYSLDQAGAAMWTLLESGCRLSDIAQWIADAYHVTQAQAEADVQRIASELLAEQLLLPAALSAASPSQPPPPARQPYDSPQLHIYRDIGDILAVDPPMPALRDTPWKAPNGGSTDNGD